MRTVTLQIADQRWQTAIDEPTAISIPLRFDGPQPRAFGLDSAAAEPIGFDGELADVRHGGSFNCSSVHIVPHGNGTHTESAAHVSDRQLHIGELLDEGLIPSTLLTVETTELAQTPDTYPHAGSPGDLVISEASLAEAAARLELPDAFLRAVVVRTTPNHPSKNQRDYSGTNPPYLTGEAIDWLGDRGVEHLLVDLPSIDREDDGGTLLNHRTFWGLTDGDDERLASTITEMIYAPDELEDGPYFLDIQIPHFALDAAPSRPLLYEATPVGAAASPG